MSMFSCVTLSWLVRQCTKSQGQQTSEAGVKVDIDAQRDDESEMTIGVNKETNGSNTPCSALEEPSS